MTARRLFAVLLIILVVFGSSCGQIQESDAAGSSADTETEAASSDSIETETEPESLPAGFGVETETARRYGLTEENYPKLDGSTSTFSIVMSLFTTFFDYSSEAGPDGKWPETPSKTVPSYRKLIHGEADMIFVPYASSDVLKEAEDAGTKLEFHRVAAEALVFLTHEDNETENITREQVRDIYLNYGIRNWKELGGPDRELIPVCRNADSGSQSQMDNLILDDEPIDPEILDHYQLTIMWDVLEMVRDYQTGGISEQYGLQRNCFALGYSLFTYVEDAVKNYGMNGLKYLAYEGILPSEESIRNGTYPLSDGYYAVLRADTPADHPARKVLQYLQSEEGQRMLEERTLMLPAKDDPDVTPSGGYLDPDSEEQAEKNEEQQKKDIAELADLLQSFGWEGELNKDSYMEASAWLMEHRNAMIESGTPAGRIDYYYRLLQSLAISEP
ncbi:MAG: substrate-binding domain-containing protein [Lachnospiraceae bacterium]|nr:substrate-binding domain-containing protein [Lachnospiraceae bacterium]